MNSFNIQDFLKKNVKPATGCTEIIAVGYATSLAYFALFNKTINIKDEIPVFPSPAEEFKLNQLKTITVKTDRDVYKNAFAVSIPGTNSKKGIAMATAIGFYCNPRNKLNLFGDLSENIVRIAKKIINSGKIQIDYLKNQRKKLHLDIRVSLEYIMDNNILRSSYVRLQDEHDNITTIKRDGKILYEGSRRLETVERETFPKEIEELIEIIKTMSIREKEMVFNGIKMNSKIAEEGLKGNYGQAVGQTLRKIAKINKTDHSLIMNVRIMSAAAADARMGGCDLPVMSTSGSGNQGITALVPIAIIGDLKKSPYQKICEAALLSHLITKMTHLFSTHLSALCGCAIKAGIGATAGITYLLNGSLEQIHNAINLLAANITGIICDGAKAGCALKLSTAAGVATESALMALEDVTIPSDNGIICQKAEDTIKAIGRISDSMVETDYTIIDIMRQKESRDNANKFRY
jgi:L-cysteine desulfidase